MPDQAPYLELPKLIAEYSAARDAYIASCDELSDALADYSQRIRAARGAAAETGGALAPTDFAAARETPASSFAAQLSRPKKQGDSSL